MNPLNWLEDFDFKFADYPNCEGCRVHAGFQIAYSSLHPEVIASIKILNALYPSSPVWTIGHSLGGALVAFSALDII